MTRAAVIGLAGLLVLAGCATPEATVTPSSADSDRPSTPAGSATEPSPTNVASGDPGVEAGTYAEVVTTDLVLRSDPGIAPESEIFPDRLNAPMTVYVADGPVEADGYRWFLVQGLDDQGVVPQFAGWAAEADKNGEVWLQALGHSGGTWSLTETSDAPSGMNTGSAAMGADGSIYLFGAGKWADEPNDGAWAYDPSTDAWSQVASLRTPRSGALVTATDDGHLYVIGGAARPYPIPGIVDVYDSETDRWTSGDHAPEDGSVVVTGADGRIHLFSLDGLSIYDREASTWETEQLESLHAEDAIVSGAGEMYVVRGGAIDLFDASSRERSPMAEPRFGRDSPAVVIGTDGSFYVIGGAIVGPGATCTSWRIADAALSAIQLVETFDPVSMEWSTIAPLPERMYDVSAFVTARGITVVGSSEFGGGPVLVAHLELPTPVADATFTHSAQEPEPAGCGVPS